MVQQKTTRETEIEKFISHRSWRKFTACLKGPHGDVKAGCRQIMRQDLGHVPLVGSMDRVLWGSQTKAGLVNLNQQDWNVDKLREGLSKGHTGEGPGRWKVSITGLWRKLYEKYPW